MQSSIDVRARLKELDSLPSFPSVAENITRIALDDKSSAEDLAKAISHDQAFALKVLKTANSAYYGFYRQIASVREAVTLLGFDEIKLMSMAISVYDLYKSKNLTHFNRKDLWLHGISVAYVANDLQRNLGLRLEEAYVGGLLHDIGKVIMDEYLPAETKSLLTLSREHEIDYLEAEKKILGMDHGELAYLVAEGWNLPPEVSGGIRYHHADDSALKVTPLAAVIALSDFFSWQVGYGGSPTCACSQHRSVQNVLIACLLGDTTWCARSLGAHDLFGGNRPGPRL